MLDSFKQASQSLEESARILQSTSSSIEQEVSKAIMQLQFQAQVSQKLTLIQYAISELPNVVNRKDTQDFQFRLRS